MNWAAIIKAFKANETFLISTHVNPDPDAIFSELALAGYLRSIGKTVDIINEEKAPKRLEFIKATRDIKSVKDNYRSHYDFLIVVDCGELSRIGKVRQLIKENTVIINIDHHITNTQFGQFNLVDPKSSSAAEILYELFKKAKCRFTDALAMYLYIGIMTDTGSFRYENTSSRTHAIIAELMKYKILPNNLYSKLYETIGMNDYKVIIKIISRLETLFAGQVICLTLKKNDISRASKNFDLKDTLFKFLRAIKGVEVFIIFVETGAKVTRVNFRSTNRVDVASLASYFQGGGHRRASGCVINKGILKAKKHVLQQIKKVL